MEGGFLRSHYDRVPRGPCRELHRTELRNKALLVGTVIKTEKNRAVVDSIGSGRLILCRMMNEFIYI